MWSVLVFAVWGLSQVTLAQDDGDVSATVPPLSRLLEDIDGDFIDSLVNVADSIIDQVFPTGDVSTSFTSSSITTTAEPSTSVSSIVTATSSEEETTTSPTQSETAAASCCDDDDDDDNLGIILGSVFGALALIGLALLIFFCCRRRRSKKRKTRDVAEVEKNPSDSEAFLAGSPTVAHTTIPATDAPNYTGNIVPSPPSSAWVGAADQRRGTGSSSPIHERRQSTQPLIAPPRSMTATGEQHKHAPGGRPVVHPGIGELPADVESQPLRESTPSANGAASELSSDKAQDGRHSSMGLPMNTNTNTVSSIANTDATNDGSILSTLDHPSLRSPWVGNGGIAAATVSRHGSTKGLGSGPGPYDSDIAFRDQLSRSPPPMVKVPAQFNPYAFDEHIYENPTGVSGHNTQIQPSSGPTASGNYFDSSKHHGSYNSSNSSSGAGITNANSSGKQKAADEYNKYTNTSDGDLFKASTGTPYSDNRDFLNQPQSRSHPHPPSLITSSLPQHNNSTDGFGEVSPLVSPPIRNPLRPHSGQYHGANFGREDATNFDFGFAGGSGYKPGPAGVR